MEENLGRDNKRDQCRLRELEVSTCSTNFSGLNFYLINLHHLALRLRVLFSHNFILIS